MSIYRNPFAKDPDRSAIWSMLVERDIRAFAAGEWGQVSADFFDESFLAVDGRMRSNPDSWRLGFASLDAYRSSWLEQSAAMRDLVMDLERGLYEATTLRDIELQDDRALAHKKFDGQIRRRDGGFVQLHWQTLYVCSKVDDDWRIAGFVGYLPHSYAAPDMTAPTKEVPEAASQHVGAGPYSPVLAVNAGRMVVISGQAAIGPDGSVMGTTIEAQTRATLDNCRQQLATAGSSLHDVFKANVYLADLGQWDAFNAVYREMMPPPLPVRTAVGARLLPGLLVEVEMWAVKR